MPPDGFFIGPIKIYFYGILIMLGVLAATYLSSRRAPMYDQDPEMAWDILPWALIGGIIGARLWHILTPPASMVERGITTAYYLTHPLEALNIRNGGLGIPGAVIGGFIAVYIYTHRKELSVWVWADIVAPGLALAQAIGRWGNFFNQELYGGPTNLPWKLYIAPERRLPEFADVAYYHPLFLYEMIWNLLNAGVLIYVSRRFKDRLKTGDVFLMYMAIYGVGRFFLEFLRLDPSPVVGININQMLMGGIAIVSAVILYLRHRSGGKQSTSPSVVDPVIQETGEESPRS
ncbi:MAG: prolipoprotein diacylglyceryl transferase [Chloroflexi bacterium]|nr:prolipoprotein diacylglyceryl transferase [Chloroflexota bacterium]